MQMGISGPSEHLEPGGKRDDLIHMSCVTEYILLLERTAFHPLHTKG